MTKQEIDKLYELQKTIHEKHAGGNGDYYGELLEQERVAAGANLTERELHSVKVLLNYCVARGIPRETAYQLLALVGFRISDVRRAN